MKIKRTVHPKDKPTNFDEYEAKKLKQHQIRRMDSYIFQIGKSKLVNEYFPLEK